MFVVVVLAYLYSAGSQHGNLHPAGRPILFCEPTQEPCVSNSQYRKKSGEALGKMQVNGPKGRNKQGRSPGSKLSMYSYIVTYSRL